MRPSQGLRRLRDSLKTKPRFYRTIHLEVMPDSNARLDGITMRGVLSICKAGSFHRRLVC